MTGRLTVGQVGPGWAAHVKPALGAAPASNEYGAYHYYRPFPHTLDLSFSKPVIPAAWFSWHLQVFSYVIQPVFSTQLFPISHQPLWSVNHNFSIYVMPLYNVVKRGQVIYSYFFSQPFIGSFPLAISLQNYFVSDP